jgi:hypothetical protein
MFTIDAGKARTFLAEALRRHAQDNIGCHGDSAIPRLGVGWTLSPGWDYHDDGFYSDDLNHVEDLIYHAVQAGVISGPGDLDLMCYSGQDPCSDWMYQYRVSFHPGCAFALCDPYRHEFRHLGRGYSGRPRGKGSASAWAVLAEAVAYANMILDGFLTSGGRIPVAATGAN